MRPVLWAAWFGHLEAMKFLINSGATPRCTNKVRSTYKITLFYIFFVFKYACLRQFTSKQNYCIAEKNQSVCCRFK